jgi:4-aminobutyrate aminotransferase-like enzyme
LATASATSYGQGAFPTVPESYYILTPECFRCPVEAKYPDCNILCLKVSKEFLSGARQKIAAIIFEPILSAGGMIFPPPDYFKGLKNLADEFEALLIADEAQTFGRTGKWFGVEHYGIVPDILVTSKGVGGGFPTSCVITTDAIADEVTGKLSHFSSHQSDPVAAAAAVAVIDVIKREGLIEKTVEKGEYLLQGLREVSERCPHIANIRGKGLMVGFDIFEDPIAKSPSEALGYAFRHACRQKGVHVECVRNGMTFRILPPLTITYEQIDRFLSVVDEAMKEALAGKYSLDDTLPKNPYTRLLALKWKKKTFKATVNRLWETSPKYWVDKLKEKVT